MKRIYTQEVNKHIGEQVKLCGWVATKRDHGKIVFIDLRDKKGIVQVVTEDNRDIRKIKTESVIEVIGRVKERPPHLKNNTSPTGSVEVEAVSVNVLSIADDLPFAIEKDKNDVAEEIRLKYRYLDLRRTKMRNNLHNRAKIIQFLREYLCKEDFTEVETPYLSKSTPEGARDYLVPSRLQNGYFYALPQSPQQYKQLLMVAGLEKYFQVVRCFRDEDTRGDRQAEFTQLDIEMSFIENEEDILELVEDMFTKLIEKIFPEKHVTFKKWPRISYGEAINKYGSDKPDLRKNKQDPNELAFAFVVDFPMFEKTETGKLTAVHHPFTAPKITDISELKNNTMQIKAKQFDFVLNGYEVGGGSIRTHDPAILTTVFEVLGHTKEDIKRQFEHLLQAFRYGVPPHGGIAPGIDRIVMLLQNEPNIREVIAFPKTGDGRDLTMDAPSTVSKAQLDELGIRSIDKKEKKDRIK